MRMHVHTTLKALTVEDGGLVIGGLLRPCFCKAQDRKYENKQKGLYFHNSKLPKSNDIRGMNDISNLTCSITYSGNLSTQILHLASGNAAATDAPIDNHGLGRFLSPTDMCSASLAACMLTVMGIKAEERGLDMKGARADLKKVMYDTPRRIGEIHIKMYLPVSWEIKDRKVMEAVALSCPVAKSLGMEVLQDVEFLYE
jgi:putative redox protein